MDYTRQNSPGLTVPEYILPNAEKDCPSDSA